MKKISAIIVDDEALAREQLARFLEEVKHIEVAATCENGNEAIQAIIDHQPQIVFLDIEMPQIDGFDVIESISEKNNIHWIFVTAYDQYAVRAFEVEAQDYLLKPYDKKRFLKTISRIQSKLLKTSEEEEDFFKPLEKLLVKEDEQIKFINCQNIISIQSEGNYIIIQSEEGNYTIRYALKDIAEKLHPRKFFRIHRSMIVNIEFVESIEPWFSGDYKVQLKNGEKIKMSRNYKDVLEKFK